MNSLEFTAKIERGMIRLPKEFDEYDNAVVRVVVSVESSKDNKSKERKIIRGFQKSARGKFFCGD